MRLGSAAALCLLTALPAHAGCGSQVAQCVYIDGEDQVRYNGLCAATVCANMSEAFYFLRYPNSTGIRIDFFRDGAELPHPEINGIPAAEIVPAREAAPWIFRTGEGEIFIMIDCPTDCQAIDPAGYAKLLEQM